MRRLFCVCDHIGSKSTIENAGHSRTRRPCPPRNVDYRPADTLFKINFSNAVLWACKSCGFVRLQAGSHQGIASSLSGQSTPQDWKESGARSDGFAQKHWTRLWTTL